jgi:molybdate transport system substrate-binding protein
MNMRRALLLICLATISGSLAAQSISVAAAADLNFALNELTQKFQTASGTKVTLAFGASGNLFSQIQAGAPFDIFFSADEEYPRKLASAGALDEDSVRIYAVGHLVLWVSNSIPLDPNSLQMPLLTKPEIVRIAIANPQHAPYGRAAMAALEHYGLKDKLSGKLVFGESVSQAAQFVQSGNAQAGLIALSLARSPAMVNAGKYWKVPQDAYPELRQAVGILSRSTNKKAAQAFINFVLSPEGAAIFQKYGLTPPAQR